MALMKKLAGFAVGASALAFVGGAMAQGVPPNPFIANHAQAAGQMSTYLTPMGETGVLPVIDTVRVAELVTVQPVAVVPVQQPAPQVTVIETPDVVVQPQRQMGAAPAPVIVEQPRPVIVPRADRG